MPKTKISEYSTTNASNTDIEGINIDEGCAPSGINNAIRELMVHLKEFQTGASGDPLTVAGTFVASGSATLNGTSIPASKTLADINSAQTFTTKRIDPRVSSTTSTSSITPDISAYDIYAVTAQAATLTFNAPTGTPVNGNKLIFRVLDNGTPQTLSWNAIYKAIGTSLPTITVANKTIYVGCIYNAAATAWDVVATAVEA